MAHVGEDIGREAVRSPVADHQSGGASERRATVPSSTEHRLDATRIAGHERYSTALRSHEGRKFLHF